MKEDISKSRSNYQRGILLEGSIASHPFDEFNLWLETARTSDLNDYNAFTLCTDGADGFPDARIVLLRAANNNGLTFFTNYHSNKAKELEHSNKVCANFFWVSLERQVRIYGVTQKVSAAESDEYFSTRPRESQIGAWASPQSSIIHSREELDSQVAKYTTEFEGRDVPRPEHWGGYRIIPHCFEFWQGRPNRLHDRIIYRIDSDGEWYTQRLAP